MDIKIEKRLDSMDGHWQGEATPFELVLTYTG